MTKETAVNRHLSRALAAALSLGLAAFLAAPAHAGIIVSTGYDDDPTEDPLPSPWVGATGVKVLGSPGAIANAMSPDPDTDAVLIQNTGKTAITLSALSFAPSGYNLFSLAGQTKPVTIGAGQDLIVLGVDGSDVLGGVRQTVDFTINGVSYSVLDAVTKDAYDGVLSGTVNWYSAETQPWAQIDCIGCGGGNGVPEPAVAGLALLAVAALVLAQRPRKL